MLRAFLITLSKIRWAQRLITRWGFAWKMASRFVAGETAQEALSVVQTLNAKGIYATMDHLGENTVDRQDAMQATSDILEMLDQIQRVEGQANVSIKLSAIGILIDEQLCRENLIQILSRARDYHSFVRIDMEDHTLTDRTLATYWEMRKRGFDNVGVVIQTSLRRSASDLSELSQAGAKVRLVKGAYKEPKALAFPAKKDVDANYDRLACLLLDQARQTLTNKDTASLNGAGRIPPIPALATHDPLRIEYARAYARQIGLPPQACEFQMLYGIRRDLQESLAADGYPVRVYVPYGTRWYPYLMRRLAERPANLWLFVSNLFRP